MRLTIYALGIILALFVFSGFASEEAHAEVEYASYYGPGFDGQLTCSGEVFSSYDYTAASLIWPQGTILNVYYGGSVVQVRVNDCGPYVEGRTLDLSLAAAEAIGLTYAGVDYVWVEPLFVP